MTGSGALSAKIAVLNWLECGGLCPHGMSEVRVEWERVWAVRSLSRSPNFSTENPTFLPLGNLLKLPFGAPFGSKNANCCVYELRKNGGCNRHLNHYAALVFLVRMSKSPQR